MPCYSPLTAYYSREIGKSGKRGITFSRSASFSGQPLKLPCGQCVGCRLERSRQWAMRCMHEKRFHEFSWFVTLTYDDDHLPKDGSLVKSDFQKFCKRLRFHRHPFRFYMCGEYGEKNRRPHYHMILYGMDFPDKRFYKKAGESTLYTSVELSEIWQNGFVVIGDVTFESCAYVARYVVDKMTGPKAESWYSWVDDDGVVHSVLPEYNDMSRRPGIGQKYFEKYGAEVYAHDRVVINGREVRPPRFYDVKLDAIDPKRMEVLKRKRRRMALLHREDNTPERRRVRERVVELNLAERLKRDKT
uniref:Replication protein VP4 n=1 Tax=Gokushovirinae environmental samples TaxID=1478972 RepID=A0A2R3UAC3_9VIRU|nr:replication protein VP4 [Gokushovirinae environmental samples]